MTLSKFAVTRGLIALFLSVAFSGVSKADYSCNVTVNGVLAYADGSVNVHHSGRNEWTMTCNLNEVRSVGQSVQPNTCAIWTALLLQAKKTNEQVQIWFPGTGSCATLPVYGNSPVPSYIGLTP